MYFVQIVNDGTPGALYEAGDDYQLATLLLAKVLVKNGIAITPEVVECIDDSGYYVEGAIGVYVIQSETYSEEEVEVAHGLNVGYTVEDDTLYHSMYPDEPLGEFQDGRFVPSRFLLELPPDCHRLADEFATDYLEEKADQEMDQVVDDMDKQFRKNLGLDE